MHANNFIINYCTTRQAIEGVAKLLPHFHRVSTATFIVESIDTIDTSAFVVSSQQKEIFWVLDFVSKQKTNHFQGLLSSVNIISKEEVICLE